MKFASWFRKKREDDLEEELRGHLNLAAQERVERGASKNDAEHAARREFGNVELVKETTRDTWGQRWLGDFSGDFRYGLRMLAKNPGFTALAVLTLALGIGGNATVFSWIRGVLINPLPGVADSKRLVAVESVMPDGAYHSSSYPDFKDYRERNHVFSEMIGFEFVGVDVNVANNSPMERVWGLITTENYFDALGIRPAIGTVFHEQPNQALKANPYIVLGNAFWRNRFASDPRVVGRVVRMNGHPFTVLGVMPPDFNGTIVGIAAQYYVPMLMQPQIIPGESLLDRNPTFVHLMGKLKPSISIAQAQAEMSTLAKDLEKAYPDSSANVGIYVTPIWKAHYGVQDFLRSVLIFLMIVAVFVLLIACVNVANLLLARASSREGEVAIRSALGASRERLIRQLLIESFLLASAGGVCGVLLASWGSTLLSVFMPPAHLPIGLPVHVDGAVLAFTVAVTLLTAILFGLAPALRGSRVDLNHSLKEGTQRIGYGAESHRLRNLLVTSEMVLATMLLLVAGLLVRSLHNAETAGPGFNTHNVTLAAFDLRTNGYTGAQASAYFDRLAEQMRSVPGVESVSLERYVPLWFTGRSYSPVDVDGYAPTPTEDMGIDLNVVGSDYFHTLQIPLLAGRDFSKDDQPEKPLVIVVNETMAKRFWPRADATGHRVKVWGQWRTVVGVARDVKYHRIDEPPQPFLYLPVAQTRGTDANLLVRSRKPVATVIGAVRAAAQSLDAKVQPLETDDLDGLLHISLFANRTTAGVASVLGGLGILLTAIGIYGVLSYTVSRRMREFGIRVALGAQSADILRMVAGEGLRLAAVGAGVGALLSLIVARAMKSLLFGLSPADPLTFLAVGLFLAVVALTACHLPARRATRVDPMVALRHE